jgi:hypothetical protein
MVITCQYNVKNAALYGEIAASSTKTAGKTG